MKRIYSVLIIMLACSAVVRASDTLRISLDTADSIFVSRAFYLLASSMNIEASKAQIIQARLYPNPIFTGEVNVFAPGNAELFNAGANGQKAFQLEQVLLLGGKRKSEIEMAKTNAAIAELEFQNLVRQLKFQLHSDLFAIGQQQFLLEKYNNQLAMLDTIVAAYEVQAGRGNIPYKELVRLKGAYLKLNNDRAELFKPYYQAQANVQTLLQTAALIEFRSSESDITNYIKGETLDDLIDLALVNRPDLQLVQMNKTLAEQYLRYQKQLVVPDINLFAAYDQRGGAFNDQVNAGIAVPLPLWNRNQGNIKMSQFKLREQDYRLQAIRQEIISKLRNSFAFYNQTVSEYQKATSLYNEDFEITLKGMRDNFQKRNVSIVEFVDFFEAYNEVLTELVRIRIQLVTSGEELNLLIGNDIY